MRKIVAAINMTLDGFCDHTAIAPDEEIHDHYTELIRNGGVLLYGRTTYQLMECYWPELVKNPSGNASMDEFAAAIDAVPKLVFSRTLQKVEWDTAQLAKGDLQEEVLKLRQQEGKNIMVGSPGLIVEMMNLDLIDELQLCIHPVVVGSGIPLFKDLAERKELRLVNTKVFSNSGAVILYYETGGEKK